MESEVRQKQSATEGNICFVTDIFYVWPLPMLLSNVMPYQPSGANTTSATIPDVRSSGQDGIPVNSKTDQSAPSKNVSWASTFQHKLIRDTGKISKLYILARTVPLCPRNGQDFSFRPLQHDIWCLVLDASTDKIKFMLLCACQDLARSGVDIEDVDCGEGIHPVADEAWMKHLIRKREWSHEVYEAKDVVSRPVGRISHYTVLLHVVKREHREFLREIRRVLGYNSDALVRISYSNIERAGGKEWITEVESANPEDPAPCKHRGLPVARHRRGA
jgi:hypothetical protein